jgi:hypothetical protein
MQRMFVEHAHEESLIQAPSAKHERTCLTCLLCTLCGITIFLKSICPFLISVICHVVLVPMHSDTFTLADVFLEGLQRLTISVNEQKEEQKQRDEKIFKYFEESRTECRSMSEATKEFASDLLGSLGLSWSHAPSNVTQGTHYRFSWKGGEEKNTGNAVRFLRKLLKGLEVTVQGGEKLPVEVQDVHTLLLNPVKGDHKEANGKTDALIRVHQPEIDDTAKFAWALCAVEFKTDKVKLGFYQQLLELVSLTHMSDYRQGAVLLGTDLNKKWEMMYFERPNHVVCQPYKYGSVAISELKNFLASASERSSGLTTYKPSLPQPVRLLPVHEEQEQNLDAYDRMHDPQADNVQQVQNLMRNLKHLFNAEVCAPSWLHTQTREVPFGVYT